MVRLNKLISAIVLICFLLNTAVSDLAFGQNLNIHNNSDKLAPPLETSDIAGIIPMDKGKIKFALKEQLIALDHIHKISSMDVGAFQAMMKRKGIKSVPDKTIFKPADMQFFWHEPKPASAKYLRYMVSLKDKYSPKPRIYYVSFSLQPDDKGDFPINVFTEEQYKNPLKVKRSLPDIIAEKDAADRYVEHEEAIDSYIRDRIKAGDFAEIEGRAQGLGWDEKYEGRVRPKVYWPKDCWRYIKAEIEHRFEGLKVDAEKAFEGKNIVFIRMPNRIRRPKIYEKDQTGVPVLINVVEHTSNNSVYVLLEADEYDEIQSNIGVVGEGEVVEDEDIDLLALEYGKKIIDALSHAAGVPYGLPWRVKKYGFDYRIVNDLDVASEMIRNGESITDILEKFPSLRNLKLANLDHLISKDGVHRDFAATSINIDLHGEHFSGVLQAGDRDYTVDTYEARNFVNDLLDVFYNKLVNRLQWVTRNRVLLDEDYYELHDRSNFNEFIDAVRKIVRSGASRTSRLGKSPAGGALKNIKFTGETLSPEQEERLLEIAKAQGSAVKGITEEILTKDGKKWITLKVCEINFDKDSFIDRLFKASNITGSYNIDDQQAGVTYIFIRKGIESRNDVLNHETLEAAWKIYLQKVNADKNDTVMELASSDGGQDGIQRAAHVLAWANQIAINNLTKVEDCPLIKSQLDSMLPEELAGVVKDSGERQIHDRLLAEYFSGDKIEIVKKFNESVRKYAEKRIAELSVPKAVSATTAPAFSEIIPSAAEFNKWPSYQGKRSNGLYVSSVISDLLNRNYDSFALGFLKIYNDWEGALIEYRKASSISAPTSHERTVLETRFQSLTIAYSAIMHSDRGADFRKSDAFSTYLPKLLQDKILSGKLSFENKPAAAASVPGKIKGFFDKKIASGEFVVCLPAEVETMLVYYGIKDKLVALGLNNVDAIMKAIQGRELVFVKADKVEWPVIEVPDDRGRPWKVMATSYSDKDAVYIPLEYTDWTEFQNMRASLSIMAPWARVKFDVSLVPVSEMTPLQHALLEVDKGLGVKFKFNDSLIREAGFIYGLGAVAIDRNGLYHEYSNALTELDRVIAVAPFSNEKERRVAELKEALKNIKPVVKITLAPTQTAAARTDEPTNPRTEKTAPAAAATNASTKSTLEALKASFATLHQALMETFFANEKYRLVSDILVGADMGGRSIVTIKFVNPQAPDKDYILLSVTVSVSKASNEYWIKYQLYLDGKLDSPNSTYANGQAELVQELRRFLDKLNNHTEKWAAALSPVSDMTRSTQYARRSTEKTPAAAATDAPESTPEQREIRIKLPPKPLAPPVIRFPKVPSAATASPAKPSAATDATDTAAALSAKMNSVIPELREAASILLSGLETFNPSLEVENSGNTISVVIHKLEDNMLTSGIKIEKNTAANGATFEAYLLYPEGQKFNGFVRDTLGTYGVNSMTRETLDRFKREISIAAMKTSAPDIGKKIWEENCKYNLILPFEFFANDDFKEHQSKYGNRFNLEWVGGSTKDIKTFIDNVLKYKIKPGEEDKTVVLVPIASTLVEEDIEKLKEGLTKLKEKKIRFTLIDYNDLLLIKSIEKTERARFQEHTYSAMTLFRNPKEGEAIDPLIYTGLSYYLRSHFDFSDNIKPDEYIEAIRTGNVAVLIKGYISYRKFVIYDAVEDHRIISETLIFA